MKYKDRKNAKRKYKQALLATVATMTLGVSTLGSTASVFAEENTQQQQSAMAPAIDGSGGIKTDESVFKQAEDGTITVLKEKLFNINTLKAIGSLGGATLKEAWADRNAGNFNNTFRTLAMGSAALIPYGGVVISPLIGLLWPENNHAEQAKLKQLLSEIAKQTHSQIAEYDLEALTSRLNSIRDELEHFEKIMNPIGRKIAAAPSVGDGPDETRKLIARIHGNFKLLVDETQKPSYKESERPIFMAAATAHLQFLNYLALYGKDPKINYDDKGLEIAVLTPLAKAKEDYKKYAMADAKKALEAIDAGAHRVREAEQIGDNTSKYGIMKAYVLGTDKLVRENFDTSINEISLKRELGIKTDFTLDREGRTFYYDPQDNKMQTGWKEISTSFAARIQAPERPSAGEERLSIDLLKGMGLPYSWYYFSPEKTDEFEKGQMYQNTTKTINGKTYAFAADGKCINPDGDEIPGWHKVGTSWYFYSNGNAKNSDGKTFAKNEQVTGWYQADGKWYYLTPKSRTNKEGTTFDEGQLVVGTLSIKDTKGKSVEYKFNNDGSLKN